MRTDKVVHELAGKYGWKVYRGTDLASGGERYSVCRNENPIADALSWNEAYRVLDGFIKEAESALEALMELATYNKAAESDRAPESREKGKRNG